MSSSCLKSFVVLKRVADALWFRGNVYIEQVSLSGHLHWEFLITNKQHAVDFGASAQERISKQSISALSNERLDFLSPLQLDLKKQGRL